MASTKKADPLQEAIEELTALRQGQRESPAAMGRILAGLDGTDRQIAAKAVGLSRRTVFYLVSIARAVEAKVLSEADVAELGWARARVLVAPASKALRQDQKPRRLPRRDIKAALVTPARVLAAGTGHGPQRSLLEIHATEAEAGDIRRALEAFGAEQGAGPKARAKALQRICLIALEQAPDSPPGTAP
jgi:hypothetical protein